MINLAFKEARVQTFIKLQKVLNEKRLKNLKLDSLQLEDLDNIEEMIIYLKFHN